MKKFSSNKNAKQPLYWVNPHGKEHETRNYVKDEFIPRNERTKLNFTKRVKLEILILL